MQLIFPLSVCAIFVIGAVILKIKNKNKWKKNQY